MNVDELTAPANPFDLSERVRNDVRSSGILTDLWPIVASGDRCVLAVTDKGLFVYSPTGDSGRAWKGIFDLDVSSEAVAFNLTRSGDSRYYRLTNGTHAAEIAAAVRAHGQEITVVEPSQQNWVKDAANPPAGRPAPRRPAAAGSPARARDALVQLFWGGVAVQIVAGIIVGATWPRTDVDTGEAIGSKGGVVAGYLVGSAGTLLVLVALIGWGVMLGVRAARADEVSS
ncbi:MAG: hypothetical protein EOO67_15785 [Microbacterium sp.]|nr:MAG: hypothetical protein EOO67_15785 [Microbacterium sp.]